MDVHADTSEVHEIVEECARLVRERRIPDHLAREVEVLADPETPINDDYIRATVEGEAVVMIPGPRLLALVANLRACAPL